MENTNEEDKKESKECNSNDYISLIRRAKEPFKKEMTAIPTKEEKLIYIRQQIQKYSIMKENNLMENLMSIFISFIVVVSFIVLFAKTSNTIFFKSLMFATIVVTGCIWVYLFLNMKRENKNYSIILFALEELNSKILSTFGGGYDDILKLNIELRKIKEAIEATKQNVKEGYSILDQKLNDM